MTVTVWWRPPTGHWRPVTDQTEMQAVDRAHGEADPLGRGAIYQIGLEDGTVSAWINEPDDLRIVNPGREVE